MRYLSGKAWCFVFCSSVELTKLIRVDSASGASVNLFSELFHVPGASVGKSPTPTGEPTI